MPCRAFISRKLIEGNTLGRSGPVGYLRHPYAAAKKALQRKRRRKAVPVLAAAGLSFSLASGASAAVGMGADLPSRTALVSQQMTLRDEEITDVSLATFHVFDNESMKRPRVQFAMCGCCGGCGCASGASFYYNYYNPPVSDWPAYPPSGRSINEYRHSPKRR